jgi:hypothetical protein
MRSSRFLLMLGVALGLTAAALLTFLFRQDHISPVGQALLLVVGVLVGAVVTSFQALLELAPKAFSGIITVASAESLLPLDLVKRTEVLDHRRSGQRPAWEITSAQLLGVDNSLALAKLRIELERQLRRIAYEADIDVGTRPVGLVSLMRELAIRSILPEDVERPMQEVARACNEAVHGATVSDETAAGLVRTGGLLLEYLSGIKPSERKT